MIDGRKPIVEVVTFGRDCLGNITGYRVTKCGQTIKQFIGDIYVDGSFAKAKADAWEFAEALVDDLRYEAEREAE